MRRNQTNLFFQVVAQRYERGSMTLTSHLTFGSWDDAFVGDGVLSGDARSHPPPRTSAKPVCSPLQPKPLDLCQHQWRKLQAHAKKG
jgi:hypothetical protein